MRYLKQFQKKGIRTQMRLIVAVSVVLFVFLCMFMGYAIRRLVYSNADEYTEISALRLQNQLVLYYEKMYNYYESINSNETVGLFLKMEYYNETSRVVKNTTECLTGYRILEPMIEDISLINDNIHYSCVYSDSRLDAIRENMAGKVFGWAGIQSHDFANYTDWPDLFAYAGDVLVDGEIIGTIVLSLNMSSLLTEAEEEASSLYFLADGSGEVLYSFNCAREAAEQIAGFWLEDGRGAELHRSRYYIHSYYVEDMDCYLLAAMDTAGIRMELGSVQIVNVCAFLMCAILCGSLFWLVSRGMVRPIGAFTDAIIQIRQQRQRGLKEELKLEGCKEIEDIGREFTDMLHDMEGLNRQIFRSATELYEMKIQKQEAELAWLRSQVDPHFLYNTLEAVRKMALDKDAPEIAQMAVDMGNIFRYSAKGEDIVPLEQEVAIIKSYMRIQQKRFQGKIDVYYFIPEEVLRLRVIKMLLQPIVENAIFHGLEPKHGQGSLFIGANLEGGRLCITVKDDGVGVEPEMLAELQRALAEGSMDTGRHVGTLNTNARLKLVYGSEYSMTMESRKGDGTTVVICLPAEEAGD